MWPGTPPAVTPVLVGGGLTFASLAAGDDLTCGLTTNGAAYCWSLTPPITAVAVSGGLSFASLSGGPCGLTVSGAPYCFSFDTSIVPIVSGGLSFGSFASGSQFCGVTTNGTPYCWGPWNGYGQLGNDLTTYGSRAPSPVSGGLSFVSIATSNIYHTCGLTGSGAAFCWGLNEFGQLGLGSTTGPQTCQLTGGAPFPAGGPLFSCSTTPAKVVGGLTFTQLTVGDYYSCGLTPSGAPYCWGINAQGQLGNGATSDSTCVYNEVGSLPPGTGPQDSAPCSPAPVLVSRGLTFASMSAGFQHTCALTAAGEAYCWGWNYFGQLGTGDTTNSSSPVPVTGGLRFAAIAAGRNYTCGLTTTGAAYCWGATYCNRQKYTCPLPGLGSPSLARLSAGSRE
jgi:alpha-tubulin suppressor-like RCC1 family protein